MTTRVASSPAFRLGVRFGVGGAALGVCTTLERVLHHGQAYSAANTIALHSFVAVLAGGLVGFVLGAAIDLVDGLLRGMPARRRLALCAAASVVGAAAFSFIIAPSKYGQRLPLLPGTLASGALAASLSGLALRFVTPVIARHPAPARVALLLVLAVVEWVDLHAYMRSYGNVHLAISGVSLLGAGIAVALFVGRARLPGWWLALTLGVALLGVLVTPASHAARAAVLGLGATEKLLLQHALWPLTDADGDGASAGAFGTDCDDGDAGIAPLRLPVRSRSLGCAPLRVPAAKPWPAPRPLVPTRDLVWIVVDTWRTDTPAELPPWTRSFTELVGFHSCGSRTKQVLAQIVGDAGCPKALSGSSIAGWLRDSGYDLAYLGEYREVTGIFPGSTQQPSRDALSRHARDVLQAPGTGKPRFTVVHFKGGHVPYDGAGDTPRARYDDAIAKTLAAVGQLVSALPRDAVVVVAGDHGEEFGEHDAGTHALSLYEEVLRTPVLVRGPGLRAGRDERGLGCAELVELVAGEVSDAPVTAPVTAPSFALLVSPKGTHGGLSDSVAFSTSRPDGLKLIWQPKLDIWELYDLEHDPTERHNLADARPRELRAMAEQLLERIQACAGDAGFAR
jgi:hypothetical protein